MNSSTMYLRSLKFSKSNCSHCDKTFSRDEQLKKSQQWTDKENDPVEDNIEEEDVRKCYSIVFEYALKVHGVTIDFSDYNHNNAAADFPTISNSFCSDCEDTFRQLYKYYKRFIVSAGTSSFVRYIMQDSMIWAKTTVIIRKSDKIKSYQQQWTPDNSENDEGNEDFEYEPSVSPIGEYNDNEPETDQDEATNNNVRHSLRNRNQQKKKFIKKKSKFKGKSKSYSHHNSSVLIRSSSRNFHQDEESDNSIHDQENNVGNKQNDSSASVTHRRVLRSSTLTKPRQSFAEQLSSSSSDDDKEWQPETKTTRLAAATRNAKKTVQKLRSPIKKASSISSIYAQKSLSQISHLLVKSKSMMNRDQFLKMKRRTCHNSKSRARVRYQPMFNSTTNPPQRNNNSKILKLNPCRFCSLTFTKKKLRRSHEEAEHGAELLKPKIPCTQDGCDKLFLSIKVRDKHFSVVHSGIVENLICDTCGKSYFSPNGLAQHLRFHKFAANPPDAFKCDKCPKCFKTPYALRTHIKKDHVVVKSHLCSICGASFSEKNTYRRHLRTKHADGEAKAITSSTTGETDLPYKCEECGKGWRRKDHLTQHLRGKSHRHPLSSDPSKRGRKQSKVQQDPVPIGYQDTPQDSNASYCSNNAAAADYSLNTMTANNSSLQQNTAGSGNVVKLGETSLISSTTTDHQNIILQTHYQLL